MKRKLLKKIFLILSIVFIVLTWTGAIYVIYNKGQANAGFAVIPMLFAVFFVSIHNKTKKRSDRPL